MKSGAGGDQLCCGLAANRGSSVSRACISSYVVNFLFGRQFGTHVHLLLDRRTHGIVYLTEECRLLVTELRKGKQPGDFLFTREDGEPVRDMRKTWDPLGKAAGLPGLLLHDFRGSAVRNMARRGIPQKTASTISGHKTDAIYSRHNIVSGDDIRDAARKMNRAPNP